MALMPYGLVKSVLFWFDAETSHELSLKGLNLLHKLKLISFRFGKTKRKTVVVNGYQLS